VLGEGVVGAGVQLGGVAGDQAARRVGRQRRGVNAGTTLGLCLCGGGGHGGGDQRARRG
jgi:hypothetical protein